MSDFAKGFRDEEAKRREGQHSEEVVPSPPSGVGVVAWGSWRTGTNVARAKAAADAGTIPTPLIPWSVHDLRRTVATGLQRLGVRLEVTEAVLNHISGSRGGIAGVYQRHDWASEKRAALDAWAAHITAVTEGRASAANVVTLARTG